MNTFVHRNMGVEALKEHDQLKKGEGPMMLCILDGYGENEFQDEFNAVLQAKTPTVDKLRENSKRFKCAVAGFSSRVGAAVLRSHVAPRGACCRQLASGRDSKLWESTACTGTAD